MDSSVTICKSATINNRRYLGNKYKLLPFITAVVNTHCPDVAVFADLFSGTGSVASAFANKMLITNDILYSNYISNLAWFDSMQVDEVKMKQIISNYNKISSCGNNYMTENFADTFFSYSDCSKIGFIREDIECRYAAGKLNERERALLITSLLYAMDKVANTCGHYDAFRQGGSFDKQIELFYPLVSNSNHIGNRCYNMDINEVANIIEADLVYLDPPYNSRQYCDAYHLLENVASWKKPQVFGVARKMDRRGLKSAFCTRNAPQAFESLVKSLKCKYILLSYNNMSNKGNDRSNAKISDEDIMRALSAKGSVTIFSESYKPFTTGKSNIKENEERLFLCVCR